MAEQGVGEYSIKAVFLYNLANFVTWPDSWHNRSSFFTIAIYGQDPFGKILDKTVAGEMNEGKPMRVLRLENQEELRRRHYSILFLSKDMAPKYNRIKPLLDNRPILTVADTDGFAARGGMVNLVKTKQRITVEINHTAVEQAGLFMSSKLLRLAKVVDQQP